MTHETPTTKIITIYLSHKAVIELKGWYRRDLEQPHWHYYESVDGTLYHCRKEHMIAVIESDVKEESK